METTPLAQLFADHWQAYLAYDPLSATLNGETGYNDCLPGGSEEDYQAWRGRLLGFQSRLQTVERAALSAEERLNYDIFARQLGDEIADLNFHAYRLPISKAGGFHTFFPDLPQFQPLEDAQDYADYLARLRGLPLYFEQQIGLMRLGLTSGYIPPRCTLAGGPDSIRKVLVETPQDSLFYEPCKRFPAVIGEAEQRQLSAAIGAAVAEGVLPAFRSLLKFVEEEYLPAARESIAAGELPDGAEFYTQRVRQFTTQNVTPAQVHQIGLDEVRRIQAEMELAIQATGFEGGLRPFIEFLRQDERFYAATPAALLKEVAYVMKRMDGELPRLFNTLPRLPYGIREIPAFSAPGSTTAYYFPGSGDGTRAGYYYVNTYDLRARPLYEIEALSFHEAVPGHHLQIALQQELDLPKFRRFGGFTAFVEGWALYAERLGLELGFYSDPYSNFGRLSYEMWRACRLVVDTGMHALGWTRQQAIDFMLAHTSSTPLNIANEVDRYIAWPGQALAYKMGEIKIRALRAKAEQVLGERFDIRRFHDVLLLAGAVPLDVLEERVKESLLA